MDGTYNIEWQVAHFNYYRNRGPSGYVADNGVVLIPLSAFNNISKIKMQNTATSAGGYAATIPHTTVLPALTTALQTVLGTYLADIYSIITNTVNNNLISMAGDGSYGASSISWEWVTTKAILPTEIQIYGSTVWSSSAFDVGEGNQKLALFNMANTNSTRYPFWLRAVKSSDSYACADGLGYASYNNANTENYIRPLIYIN